MDLLEELDKFVLPTCSCSLKNNQQIGKICLEPQCGQLLCPRCDFDHKHKDKLVVIYTFLENLVNQLSESSNFNQSPEKSNRAGENLLIDQQIEFIS